MNELALDTIVAGDCRVILPLIPDKAFQLAFVDPPYWVGFNYGNETDRDMEFIEPQWLVEQLLRVAQCVLVTPGMSSFHDYPRCLWMLSWNKPASTGRSRLGGFNIWEPILVYGEPPSHVWQDSFTAPGGGEMDANFHKCPKPLSLLKWIVENFSSPGDSVIDPCSGSGTTCKAAFQLGRHYYGVEIDPLVAEMSQRRLALSQPLLPGTTNLGSQPLLLESL